MVCLVAELISENKRSQYCSPSHGGQGVEVWLIRGRAVARSVGFCGSETEVAK